ncbi:hypothetical protein P7C70_g2469, partial [Phenoliferia sp. Uapishka_3]
MVVQPYFTEPGYEATKNTLTGESASDSYSKNTFIQTRSFITEAVTSVPKAFEVEAKEIYFARGGLVGAIKQLKDLIAESESLQGNVGAGSECSDALRVLGSSEALRAKAELKSLESIPVEHSEQVRAWQRLS